MSAGPRVLALVLDSPTHGQLVRWLDAGLLPTLAALRARSREVTVESAKMFSNEHCWIPFLTGRSRERFDHWLDHWDAQAYRFDEASIFDGVRAPLFYALGSQRRVVAFDLTAPLSEGVDGLQVAGFASELNECMPGSQPPELFDELLAAHGPDPKLGDAMTVLNRLSKREAVSHVVPTMYDTPGLHRYAQGQVESVQRRTRAALDLMARTDWDLFIAAYSEMHSLGHVAWHLGRPHPLDPLHDGDRDPVLEVMRAIDDSVAALLRAGGHEFAVFCTLDEMAADCLENARAVFLPEWLYRWNFGRAALAGGDASAPVPAPRHDFSRHWKHEVWALRTEHGEADLESPDGQAARGDAMAWCPANWYRRAWPKMRAFAMPTVSDGFIRVNVRGRESAGIVEPRDFIATCDELAARLAGMVDARTRRPLVREVLRVRDDPFDGDPGKTPADLVVVFAEEGPVDCVDSPMAGRIGPLPFFRTGAHPAHGRIVTNTMWIGGPGMEPGRASAVAAIEDMPATLLALMDVDVPPDFDGVPRHRP